MKVFFIPLFLTLLPLLTLVLIVNYWLKNKRISILFNIFLGFLFFCLGLLASFYSMTFSMKGMVENNIRCVTGSIVFIPLGILIYSIGIPSLLVFFQKRKIKENDQIYST